MLADSVNGYTWGWKLYTGKEGDQRDFGLVDKVVLDLVDDVRLQGKGFVVVTDNFYSSPSHFRELRRRGFDACGTARMNCKGLPQAIRDAPLRRGEVVSSVVDSILTLKWKDKRDVIMLSTYHDSSMITKSRRLRAAERGVEDIEKPKMVKDYNHNMGGIDTSKLAANHLCI